MSFTSLVIIISLLSIPSRAGIIEMNEHDIITCSIQRNDDSAKSRIYELIILSLMQLNKLSLRMGISV